MEVKNTWLLLKLQLVYDVAIKCLVISNKPIVQQHSSYFSLSPMLFLQNDGTTLGINIEVRSKTDSLISKTFKVIGINPLTIRTVSVNIMK